MRHNRRNPFNIGDVAGHNEHEHLKGIVKGVNGKWVKIEVISRTRLGGRPYVVRFAHHKCHLIMTYEQRIEMARGMYAMQQAEAAKAKGFGGAVRRAAAWVRRLGQGSTAPASAQETGGM